MSSEAIVGQEQFEEDVGMLIPHDKRKWLTIALLVAVFGCDFSFRSYSVALPSIISNWTYDTNLYSAGNTLCTVMQTIMTIVIARITAKKGLRKTMAGGLILGVVESLVSGFLSSTFRDAAAFAILILVLLFRPAGIFGKNTQEKV